MRHRQCCRNDGSHDHIPRGVSLLRRFSIELLCQKTHRCHRGQLASDFACTITPFSEERPAPPPLLEPTSIWLSHGIAHLLQSRTRVDDTKAGSRPGTQCRLRGSRSSTHRYKVSLFQQRSSTARAAFGALLPVALGGLKRGEQLVIELEESPETVPRGLLLRPYLQPAAAEGAWALLMG